MLVDDDESLAFLVEIQCDKFEHDEGTTTPPACTFEIDFNRNDNEFYIIANEATEIDINYGNVMAYLYFSSLDIDGPALQ